MGHRNSLAFQNPDQHHSTDAVARRMVHIYDILYAGTTYMQASTEYIPHDVVEVSTLR
jgi:hypothetical protein